MTLIIFKYCLPALLGYTLFVGIAGRLNPFVKPYQPEERPSWLLGIWTALTISLVLGVGLHMAYGMSLKGAQNLAQPTGWLMAGLLVPGFIAYFIYSNSVKNMLAADHKQSFDWAFESENPEFASHLNTNLAEDHPLDRGLEPHILDGIDIPEAENSVAETFLQSVDIDQLDTEGVSDATNNSANSTIILSEEASAVDWEIVETGLVEETTTESEAEAEILAFGTHPEQPPEILFENSVNLGTEHEQLSDALIDTSDDVSSPDQIQTAPSLALEQELAELNSLYKDERTLREETEKHLRITRKALSTIESETRHYESGKADAVINLEDKLAESIRVQSTLEAQSTREKTKRVNVETTIVNLKQDLVKAKQEVRRSIAARAKALSTANKSIAFARQNVQIRGRLESEIGDLQATLKNRQTTISSLIRTLEKEKRRTQDDVAAMAQQLVLHEKQVKARRSLEEVAKSVEMKLSSRLVKKVAKARPLISDS